MANSSVKIIYTGGYVRSGTTILNILLGMNPNSLAVGEINLIFRQFPREDKSIPCACGETLRDCPIWSQVMARFHAELPDISDARADAITRKVETYPRRSPVSAAEWDEYVQIWRVIFDATVEVSGATTLINSSKTGWHSLDRPLSLANAGYDVRLLHMIRDPRAVAWSKLRREIQHEHLQSNLSRFRAALIATFHWSFTNFSTQWRYHNRANLRYHALRHRDFVADPVARLREMGARLDLDLTPVIEIVQTGTPITGGHLVSGNEIRGEGPLKIQPQTGWRTQLPRSARWGVELFAPLALWFGYNLFD